MTVLTLPSRPAQDSKRRPVPWRRMFWVTWCQHRGTLLSVPAILGALAVFLWIAGLKVHHDYTALTACHPATSSTCQNLSSAFNGTDWTLGSTLLTFMQLVPALLGAFTGAPVLARELETGTFRYSWTQGFGRERWTIAKLVLLGIAVTAAAEAFDLVFIWFFSPFIPEQGLSDLSALEFGTHGIVFAAWTLAAFIIGAFLGMLIRRILPAMVTTLGVYLGLYMLAWQLLRRHYLPALSSNNVTIGFQGSSPVNAPWVLSSSYTLPDGKPANMSLVNSLIRQFQSVNSGPSDGPVSTLAAHHITQWWSYIPVSRFWPMQFIEAGWLLALSVLLTLGTVWLVRHRAA